MHLFTSERFETSDFWPMPSAEEPSCRHQDVRVLFTKLSGVLDFEFPLRTVFLPIASSHTGIVDDLLVEIPFFDRALNVFEDLTTF